MEFLYRYRVYYGSIINGNKCKFCVIINLIQLDYFSLMNLIQVAAM